jgi:folate-binding protein YgfZ
MSSNPLKPEHERYARVESLRLGGVPVECEWIGYGGATGVEPARASAPAADAPPAAAPEFVEILAGYGLLEIEYAAFRRGAAILDMSHRATLVVRGAERVEFLNRMVTQELKGFAEGEVRAGFWLNRKGRIDADLCMVHPPSAEGEPPALLVDLDVHDAGRTVSTLSSFLFSEDVQLADESARWGRLAVHGPDGAQVLSNAGAEDAALEALNADLRCSRTNLAGAPAVLFRRDQCGSPGVEVVVPREHVARVWDALASQHDAQDGGRRRARPAGWHAYNIARIEAGTPLFHVDFGNDNLPHESGLLAHRVSFRKGCYLGQEVVARMESLGKPKQRLVALRMAEDLLPTAGSPVFERNADGEPGNPVGTVTSSTLAPMLGAACVAFAMVRSAHAEPGTQLLVPAEGGRASATVQPALRFLPEGKGAP